MQAKCVYYLLRHNWIEIVSTFAFTWMTILQLVTSAINAMTHFLTNSSRFRFDLCVYSLSIIFCM